MFIEMGGLIEARKLIFSDNLVIQRFAMKLIAVTSTFHEAVVQLRDLDVGFINYFMSIAQDSINFMLQ